MRQFFFFEGGGYSVYFNPTLGSQAKTKHFFRSGLYGCFLADFREAAKKVFLVYSQLRSLAPPPHRLSGQKNYYEFDLIFDFLFFLRGQPLTPFPL